jgi:hypothetical protein
MGESAIEIVVDHVGIAAMPYWASLAPFGVPPHVTLLYPWRSSPIDDTSVNEVERALRQFEPFTLSLTGVAVFPRGVVYAVVQPDSLLREMARALAAAFPDTPPYSGEYLPGEPTPHLTLAKCLPDDLDRVAAEIEQHVEGIFPLALPIEAVSIEEELELGNWAVTKVLELRGTR